MGYCPQNDAIISCLSAYDHLKLFARLRGIPDNQVTDEVKKWIDRLSKHFAIIQKFFQSFEKGIGRLIKNVIF